MKRVIWLFVLEEANWQIQTKQFLRFIGKPPNNLLVVVAYQPEFTIVHSGPATFTSVRKMHSALKSAGWGPPTDWCSRVQPHLEQVARGQPIDVHCSFSGQANHAAQFTSFCCNSQFTAASNPAQYTLAVGDLHLQVDGYAMSGPYSIPKSQLFFDSQLVQARSTPRRQHTPGAARAFRYGATPVPLRTALRQSLERGRPLSMHRIDVLGFIEAPPFFLGSDPMMLRSSSQVYASLSAAMADADKVALARLQTGTQVCMATLRPQAAAPQQLLMELLPFAEDLACPQFPAFGVQPAGPWEELIEAVPKANDLDYEPDALLDELLGEICKFLD